jgi:hypothetical protein
MLGLTVVKECHSEEEIDDVTEEMRVKGYDRASRVNMMGCIHSHCVFCTFVKVRDVPEEEG